MIGHLLTCNICIVSSYSCNPVYLVYLGMNLWYLGYGIVFSPLWSALLFPALLLIMTIGVIRREERHLKALFGETYLAYKTNVRR